MRLFLVFLFLYIIPITILFLNYKNLKRSCIYGSIYTVLITTIAITNVYISGINRIKEAIIYKNNVLNTYEDINKIDNEMVRYDNSISDNKNIFYDEQNNTKTNIIEDVEENEIEVNNIETLNEESNELFKQRDLEAIQEFKKKIYETELIALSPMRECIPYTKDIVKSLKELSKIKASITLSINKCDEVISIYNDMEIPYLLDENDMITLEDAKKEVIYCYEFRKEAMKNALDLINSKNPKYISKITECLEMSDKHILNYKEKLNSISEKIEAR